MSDNNSCDFDILTYGAAALRCKSRPVEQVTAEIRELVDKMLKTMYAHRGLGLAAEQVGRDECLCIIDVPPDADDSTPPELLEKNAAIPMPLVLLNPRIVAEAGFQTGQEGCLSFPEIFVQVKRAMTVTVEYMDLDGQICRIEAAGLLSRALQHEIDHLNGVLLVDRMSPVQKVALAGRLKRLKARKS